MGFSSKIARVKEFETVHVCGMISHLLCGIVMCCVMAFFFLFLTEPAQLSERESERGKGRKPTTQLLWACWKRSKQTNPFLECIKFNWSLNFWDIMERHIPGRKSHGILYMNHNIPGYEGILHIGHWTELFHTIHVNNSHCSFAH